MTLADRIVKGVKATFAARIIDTVANAALVVILARYLLTPEEYGLLYFALSIFGVIAILGALGLPSSVARYVSEFDETDPGQVPHVMRIALVAVVGLSLVVGLAISVSSPWLADFLDEPALAPLLMLGLFYVLGASLRSYVTKVFQGFNRVTWSAVVNSLQAAGRVVFATALVLLGFGVIGALVGYILGFFVGVGVGGVVMYVQFYRGYDSVERADGIVRRLFEYSVPLTATRAAGVLDKRVDMILVGVLLNATAVGYYTVAKQIAQVAATPASSLGFTISPAFAEQNASGHADRAARLYEQALEYVLLLYVPAVVGLVLIAEPFIQHVFGADYLGAVGVLQVLSIYVLATAVMRITSDGLDYLGRARERAIVKTITSVANFFLNLLLIPTLGVVGAAWATFLTFSCYTLMNVYIISRELPIRFGGVARSLAGVSAVSVGMGIGVFLLLPYVSGLFSLFAVIAVGLLIWVAGVASSGLLDVRQAMSYLS